MEWGVLGVVDHPGIGPKLASGKEVGPIRDDESRRRKLIRGTGAVWSHQD
jgi:hypothetical protein